MLYLFLRPQAGLAIRLELAHLGVASAIGVRADAIPQSAYADRVGADLNAIRSVYGSGHAWA